MESMGGKERKNDKRSNREHISQSNIPAEKVEGQWETRPKQSLLIYSSRIPEKSQKWEAAGITEIRSEVWKGETEGLSKIDIN